MKLVTRLFACLLCLAMLSGLAACKAKESEEEVPDGMMIASCAGADYRLYVPTSWMLNTSFGVSGAYRDLANQSTVSVNRYPITEELEAEMNAALTAAGEDATAMSARIEWFFRTYCLPPVADRALDQKAEMIEDECVATTLGGANARQYRYRALVNGTTLQFLQVIAERSDVFYVFSFIATESMYEGFSADAGKMLEHFVFADPYIPPDYSKKLFDGTDAPDGMKPASGNDVAYRFYVPDSWEITMDQTVYSAYVPDDRTSVSVVPYLPDVDQLSVAEYFTMSRELLEKTVGADGFELISATQGIDLGGRQATLYEYRITLGGTVYHYRQYVAAYKSMIYSLTYTASEVCYDVHLAELEAIVQAFAFR